jgi:cardiolipin synthase (CMP-forming)
LFVWGDRQTTGGSTGGSDVDDVRTEVGTDRVLTVPNLLSFLRLLAVPLFVYLLLTERDGLALFVLATSAFTDWLDGQLARRWNQMTKLGQLLDPVVDRLFIFATVVCFVWRDIIPWWFALLVVGRDVLLALLLPVLRRMGLVALPVHFLGKAATFNLLYALPLLLLGETDNTIGMLAKVFGWAFAIWGVALYWWAGLIYAMQAYQLRRAGR